MKILTKNKTYIFRIAFIVVSVMLVSLAISISAINQAKAETNGSITVTSSYAQDSTVYEVFDINWRDPGEPFGGEESSAVIGIDKVINILELFGQGHNVVSLTYNKGDIWGTYGFWITLTDDAGLVRSIAFGNPNNTPPNYEWKINLQKFTEESSVITDLTSNYKFCWTDKEPLFGISGTVVTSEYEATPIEGALAKYYKKDGSEVEGKQAYTNADGYFNINDIDFNDAPGFLEITHDNYETTIVNITSEMAEEGGTIDFGEISLPPRTEYAEFFVKALEHHKIFHCVITTTFGSEQETQVYDVAEITGDETEMIIGATYYIDESGVMNIHYASADNFDILFTIQPVGEDGYVVDKWNTNGVDLVVGEIHEITSADTINNLVSYKIAVNNPQTGDSLPLAVVAISIIALLAGGLMLKKSFK